MSSLSVNSATYTPSWMRTKAAGAPPPSVPPAAVVVPPTTTTTAAAATKLSSVAPPFASKMTVTRTTTNATSSALSPPPPPPPPPATVFSAPPPPPTASAAFKTSYTYGSAATPGSRGGSTHLLPMQSPGGSPSLSMRLPTRFSPAMVPSPAGSHMNPNASEFVPGRGFVAVSGSSGGLDALPTSTADLEAAQRQQQQQQQTSATTTTTTATTTAATTAPQRSPAWRPAPVTHPIHATTNGSVVNSPALQPLRLDAKSEREITEISQRSDLKVEAPAYVLSRTFKRMTIPRPSPLLLAQDPAKAALQMMLDDLWCLFYLPAHFGESIKEETYNPTLIFRIESVPTFWKVFNSVEVPTRMQLSTLYLFKDGISPQWEDAANSGGGIVKVKVSADQVDEAWDLLLCKTVGDSWTPSVRGIVNGVALKVRDRGYLLEVWVTQQTPQLMHDLTALWKDAIGAAFATTYFSHAAMQSKSAASAAAEAERKKKQKQNQQRKRW